MINRIRRWWRRLWIKPYMFWVGPDFTEYYYLDKIDSEPYVKRIYYK